MPHNGPLLGTDMVTQIALVVHDIEKTGKAFAKFLGVDYPGYSVTAPGDEAQTRYMGGSSTARAKLCFFHVGPNVDLELIEPDHEPSVWRNVLNEKGEGFHHIAFVVKDMKARNAALESEGMPLVQSGEYKGGRYAYHDATDTLKVILELLEND